MRTSARLSAAIALGALVAAGAPATASAQMAAPAAVRIQSGSAMITVRALPSGGIMFWVNRQELLVSGLLDPAEVEAWALEAGRLLDTSMADREMLIGGVLGEKAEVKSPWLFAANRSAVSLDRVRRKGVESFNLFATDADNEHRLYFTLDRAQAGQVVETLRQAAAMSRQMASASAKANGGPN